MAKSIFRKKKKRNPILPVVVALCLVVAVLASMLVVRTLKKPGTDFPEDQAPVQETTTSTEPRKTLPKSFIDRNTFSPYVVLYDVTDDQILYSKNAEKKCYPASLTKLLTALVALDYAKPEDAFTLGNELYMISPGSSRAYLTVGTKMTMEQLLQALLLPSGNDAAYAIAVQVGRLIEKNPDLDRYEAAKAF